MIYFEAYQGHQGNLPVHGSCLEDLHQRTRECQTLASSSLVFKGQCLEQFLVPIHAAFCVTLFFQKKILESERHEPRVDKDASCHPKAVVTGPARS